ncbi:MAG: hypothetical protein LBE84_08075 [Planctomycetota bacterium]|jgi:hypothetical protein|nr:hypothetical protein [Planctomycetota bacterium]
MVIRPWHVAMMGVGAATARDAGIAGEKSGQGSGGRVFRGGGDVAELGKIRQNVDAGLYSAKSIFKMMGEVELISEEIDASGGVGALF